MMERERWSVLVRRGIASVGGMRIDLEADRAHRERKETEKKMAT